MQHFARRSRKLLDIVGFGEEVRDGVISNFRIPMFKQITKSTSGWLRSLRKKIQLEKRPGQSLGESHFKGTEEGDPKW